MKKELEALKRVVSEINNYKLHGIGDENWLGIQDVLKDISIIENALQQAQKQQKLLELYKEVNNKSEELIALAEHDSWSWKLYHDIKNIQYKIKDIETSNSI